MLCTNVLRLFGFKCGKIRVLFELDLKNALQIKHALSKLVLENAIQAFSKYDLGSALQTKWHLEIENKCFAPFLFSVWEKRALFKLDLKSALEAFFKYDLESDLQTKWHLEN